MRLHLSTFCPRDRFWLCEAGEFCIMDSCNIVMADDEMTDVGISVFKARSHREEICAASTLQPNSHAA
jgi:hypothetical protein